MIGRYFWKQKQDSGIRNLSLVRVAGVFPLPREMTHDRDQDRLRAGPELVKIEMRL
jgi:hypothetical protein